MARLDTDELRAYARRDWAAAEMLTRRERARLPVDEKVRIAIALDEAARRTRPDWPDDATRRADLAQHLRVKDRLRRAAHVGRR